VAARKAIDVSRLPDAMERLPAAELADPRPPAPDRETVERIEQAVTRFPAEWRRVWEMWREGTSREEMAKAVGKSVRTVQYWLAEMFDQLREHLGE
jgi:DNA-directed RNA polymerase specialized sigma24 family protein